jgi:hypothetical protein
MSERVICAGSHEHVNVAPAQVRSRRPGDSAKVAEVRCRLCGRVFTARANATTNVATIPRHNEA